MAVDLLRRPCLGLILLRPSGVRYELKTGGIARHRRAVEGVFIPLSEPGGVQESELAEFFGPGRSYNGLDGEAADFIDGVLGARPDTAQVKVDRARLKDCEEALVYVLVLLEAPKENRRAAGKPPAEGLLRGLGPCLAVLTWKNSIR